MFGRGQLAGQHRRATAQAVFCSLRTLSLFIIFGKDDQRQLYSSCLLLTDSDCRPIGRQTLSVSVSYLSWSGFFEVQPSFKLLSQGASLADSVFPFFSAVGFQQLFMIFLCMDSLVCFTPNLAVCQVLMSQPP